MTTADSAPTAPPAAGSTRVELNMLGGPTLGQGVQEYDTRLRVDLGSGTVFLEAHQPGSDTSGAPIGTFRAQASAELIERLRAAIEAVDFASLPEATGGGLGISAIELRVLAPAGARRVVWTVRDGELKKRLAGVSNVLQELHALAARSPLQAIALETVVDGAALTLVIKNVGSEPVAVRHPRFLGADASGHEWAFVQVADRPKSPPGVTPLPPEWKPLGLATQPGEPPPYLVLAPGAAASFPTVPWTRAAGGRYLVQAGFSSYAGAPMYDRTLVIRGRVYSKPVIVEP